MIGVKPGCIIRFQHTNGFLRDNDGRIDAKGDPRKTQHRFEPVPLHCFL